MKLAVVGGGSTYTPELVAGLARERERLELTEVVLHDIDAERREVVGGLATRMLDAAGYDGKLAITDDLERALDGASFVLIQLRVGGQQARLSDETIPLACGCIGQETTGAGGLAKALRTVPVVLEIASRVRELAADGAWIVDFTNPVGIVTRSLLDAGHRAVGLCNVAIGIQRSAAKLLGVEPERVLVDQVGLNHLTWVRALLLDGEDVLPDLLAERGDELAASVDLPRALLERLGVIPSYYLRYFYFHDEELASQLVGKPRAAEVAEIERELLELYRDPALTTKPKLLERRGGAFYSEAATQLVASLASDAGDAQVVDVRNNGTLAGLADDDAVEVPARITARGPEPLDQPPLAPEYLGLVQHVAAYERLAAAAAISGDRELVYKALLAHPLVGQVQPVEELTEQLLAADREHLPQFFAQERSVSAPLVLAIDGGNSKTDLALVRADGEVLTLVRGGLSSPHHLGLDGALEVIDDLLARALAEAGIENGTGPVADVGHLLLAGVDFPSEVDQMQEAAGARGFAANVTVGNDTFAVLRAGTKDGWGVAVVCGAGINCVGVTPDGRHARFPALGWTTGDWGGGYDVGLAATLAAARSEDGRGEKTTLERAVPEHFGLETPMQLAEAVHAGRIDQRRVIELAPVVFAEAEHDAAAGAIVDRLAEEVVTMIRVTLERLELTDEPVPVALGGGLMQSGDPRLIGAVKAGLARVAPAASVHVTSSPPIVGAALLGLDELGAGAGAQERLRRELGRVFTNVETPKPPDGRARPGRSRR